MLGDNEINYQSLENFCGHLRSKFDEIARYVVERCNTLEENKKMSHLFNDRLLNLFAFVAENNLKLSKWEDDQSNVRVLDAKPMFVQKAIDSCQVCVIKLGIY